MDKENNQDFGFGVHLEKLRKTTKPQGSHYRTAQNVIDRYNAGDSIQELATDYNLEIDTICLIIAANDEVAMELVEDVIKNELHLDN